MKQSTELPLHQKQQQKRRRRLCCICCLTTLIILIIIAIILAFTIFKVRQPTITLLSTTVSGVSPRISFPTINIQLNLTLTLQVLVHNPNRASFEHSAGTTLLRYRGTEVGQADVPPGTIPARGDGTLVVPLTLEVDALVTDLATLISDIVAGSVTFDTSTRLSGKVKVLGFVKFHAVATSECVIVVGFPQLSVKSQQCSMSTKL